MRVRYFLSKNRKNVQSIIDRFFLGGGGEDRPADGYFDHF